MAKTKTSLKPSGSSKTSKTKVQKKTKIKPYDPSKELLDKNLIAKAFMQCLSENDPEGAAEILTIHLEALGKYQPISSKIKGKNTTLKDAAMIFNLRSIESRK